MAINKRYLKNGSIRWEARLHGYGSKNRCKRFDAREDAVKQLEQWKRYDMPTGTDEKMCLYRKCRIYSKPNHGKYSTEYCLPNSKEKKYANQAQTRGEAIELAKQVLDEYFDGTAMFQKFCFGGVR